MKSPLKLGSSTPSLVIACLLVEPSFVNDHSTDAEILDLQLSLSGPYGCTVASSGLSVNAPSDPV